MLAEWERVDLRFLEIMAYSFVSRLWADLVAMVTKKSGGRDDQSSQISLDV